MKKNNETVRFITRLKKIFNRTFDIYTASGRVCTTPPFHIRVVDVSGSKEVVLYFTKVLSWCDACDLFESLIEKERKKNKNGIFIEFFNKEKELFSVGFMKGREVYTIGF